MKYFTTTYRVIYGDVDSMKVAYHANYLRWFEIGRTELIRNLGLPYAEMEEMGFLLPVSEAYLKYIKSARYDEVILIYSGVHFVKKGLPAFRLPDPEPGERTPGGGLYGPRLRGPGREDRAAAGGSVSGLG
jgi:acyl-CoA thioester hydrolase